MIVKCDMMNCPWNINTDCSKPLVSIKSGHCILFNQVMYEYMMPVDDRLKQEPTIVEVDYDECGSGDEVECERELCEEALQETSRESEKAGDPASEDRKGS
jgi:hypothetical protein